MANLVQGILDNEMVRTALYSAAAGLGITTSIWLAKSPDATPTEKRVAWAAFAFEVLLALWATIQAFRWISRRAAASSGGYGGAYLPMY